MRRRRAPEPWELLVPTPRPPTTLRQARSEAGEKNRLRGRGKSGKLTKLKGPEKKVTDAARVLIKNMASYGFPPTMMAALAGVTLQTLRRNYAHELSTARIEKDLKVLDSAFLQAVGGLEEDWEKARPSMTAKYLEARGIWPKEGERRGPDAPIDVTKLTKEQLDAYEQILIAGQPDGVEEPARDGEGEED